MNQGSSTINLPLAAFRLRFHAGDAVLTGFTGSAWRGALGRALKRTVCVVRDTPCGDCMLLHTCAYPYIFETPPPPDAQKMRRYSAAPHPFVLDVGMTASGEGAQVLGLNLFGEAYRYLPYLIHALEKAGEHGLSKRRVPLTLTEVSQWVNFGRGEWRTVFRPGAPLRPEPAAVPDTPPLPRRLTVHLETPLRLRREEQYVAADTFRFADLFGNLLRRISMVTYFHTRTPLETDFAALVRGSERVQLSGADLRWFDWTRYSSRQKTTMQMGGLLGTFELDGADIEAFWPYLWLGQWTHAGKGTSMGLGRYRIEAASLPPRQDPGRDGTL